MVNIVNMKDVPKNPRISTLFNGNDVTDQPLIPAGGDYNMSIVNFGRGVRNKFHIHESDQILIVRVQGLLQQSMNRGQLPSVM
jgi:hypothetical protein